MLLDSARGCVRLPDDRPKALVEVGGRTLLEITLRRLRSFGVREVIVNVHHFADLVVEYLKANDYFGMKIEISREDDLLDTGGGLKKAADFFLRDVYTQDESVQGGSARVEPFILHNVDVLSSIDLGADGEISLRAGCAGNTGDASAEELTPTSV